MTYDEVVASGLEALLLENVDLFDVYEQDGGWHSEYFMEIGN